LDLDLLSFKAPEDGKSLLGNYYITVKSDSLTHYTITPVVFKKVVKEGSATTTYIPLFEGTPQKI
jgi:hypothetical protein